jgi:hypothetical protein
MKLSESQAGRVWTRMVEAEIRSLYFADLATRQTSLKQWITGGSLFLSSGAAATIASNLPFYIPLIMSALTAALSAYSIAAGLDKRISAMVRLHDDWNRLQLEYERLWHHWEDDDAEDTFRKLQDQERILSQAGIEIRPYDEALIDKWSTITYERHRPTTT